MTSEAAETRPIIFSINYPCMPKAIPYRTLPAIPDKHANGLRWPQNDLGGCRDQAYHFQHQKLPLYARSREPFHTGHGRPFRTTMQANKQTNKFLFALYIERSTVPYLYTMLISVNNFNLITFTTSKKIFLEIRKGI